jgi:hypothetical protein
MNEKICKILEAAIQAPSGDNCQPWRFAVSGNQVDLYDVPEADTSYYNYLQRASLVAHGALLENIAITAPTVGFNARFDVFPVDDDPGHVARITLEDCPARAVELAPCVPLRCTNRKRYRGGSLDDGRLAALAPAGTDLPKVSVYLTNKRQEIKRLAEVICLGDRLVFENQRLHTFLFEHIRWSDEEAAMCRDGLDIKTLELKAMDALGIKMLRNWQLTSLLGKLGVARAVAGNARKLACSASTIGIILGSDLQDPDTCLQGGRLLQRIWLQATRMGLSFHLMAGICFLMQRVVASQADELALQHIRLVKDAVRTVKEISRSPGPNVIGLFRVGLADPPSTRSHRKELSQFIVS